MTTQKTPALYTKGIFTLGTPFTLTPNVVYTCEAIRSFQELINAGVDIFTTYYEPVSLTETQYETDLAAGANLITLMAPGYATVYVPDTYITAYPQVGNVAYSTVVLGVSLGPVPDALDLTFLKEQIADVVSGVIGIAGTVAVVVSPSTDVMTPQQAQNAEDARQAAITNRTSDYAKLQALQAQFNALQTQYNALQAWVVANYPGGSTPPP